MRQSIAAYLKVFEVFNSSFKDHVRIRDETTKPQSAWRFVVP